MKKVIYAFVVTIALVSVCPGSSEALTFPTPSTTALNYGDFYSYSLPVLAYLYDQQFGGGTGPGNPYYIPSTPGHISGHIVVATGASGGPVNTNFPGMDDAYPTPNSSGITTFSTGTTPDPGFSPPMPANNPNTWDTTIAALMGQMGGATPFFYFNNNQINSGDSSNQNLWAFAQIELWSSGALASPLYYDLVSHNGDGSGEFGGDPLSYTSPTYSNPSWQPTPFQDYVLSGGATCLDAFDVPIDCADAGAVTGPFNHNLGANQAAYVVFAPEMNAFLGAWDDSSPYDMMSIDFRMHSLNNGYEQAFIVPGEIVGTPIPEPSSVFFMVFGVVAVFFTMKMRST